MADCFISYKSEEFKDAYWVKSVLESNGLSCWIAPQSIPGGSNYAVEIPRAIHSCGVFVLVLSANTQESKWVPREIDQAINDGKVILPFVVENCSLKEDFNFYLSNVQRYPAYEDKEEAMEKMLRDIKHLLDIKDSDEKDQVASFEPIKAEPVKEVSDTPKISVKSDANEALEAERQEEPKAPLKGIRKLAFIVSICGVTLGLLCFIIFDVFSVI